MSFYWKPYVPVAKRRAKAMRHVDALKKKGKAITPVVLEGRHIARSFWGGSWCTHLEKFSDYENRLPRGRTYVRNGSVCHLEVNKCEVVAIVSGSDLYHVKIAVEPLDQGKWATLKRQCEGKVSSLIDLLQGKLSDGVMAVVTDKDKGMFPHPTQIKMKCSCPDWATMCKHVAAVLYGVGARLDHAPELLFKLRGVDHAELVEVKPEAIAAATKRGTRRRLAGADLSDVFGVDIQQDAPAAKHKATAVPRKAPSAKKAKPAGRPTIRRQSAAQA